MEGKRYRVPKHEFTVFAKRFEMAIKRMGINAARFCELSGISKGSISLYLSAAVMPANDRIVKIAELLDVSPAWLFGADINPDGTAITEPDHFNNPSRMALAKLVKHGSDEDVSDLMEMWNIIKKKGER